MRKYFKNSIIAGVLSVSVFGALPQVYANDMKITIGSSEDPSFISVAEGDTLLSGDSKSNPLTVTSESFLSSQTFSIESKCSGTVQSAISIRAGKPVRDWFYIEKSGVVPARIRVEVDLASESVTIYVPKVKIERSSSWPNYPRVSEGITAPPRKQLFLPTTDAFDTRYRKFDDSYAGSYANSYASSHVPALFKPLPLRDEGDAKTHKFIYPLNHSANMNVTITTRIGDLFTGAVQIEMYDQNPNHAIRDVSDEIACLVPFFQTKSHESVIPASQPCLPALSSFTRRAEYRPRFIDPPKRPGRADSSVAIRQSDRLCPPDPTGFIAPKERAHTGAPSFQPRPFLYTGQAFSTIDPWYS
jgi:hypothetical protein